MHLMNPTEASPVLQEWAARQQSDRRAWIEPFTTGPDHTAAAGASGLVSVILPTRDRGRMTRTAIESVVAQTWSDWELLVIDDGSQDDTPFVAEILAGRDPRIRVVRAEARGAAAARNTGLRMARGAFIAFLDSDVRWEPDVLRALMAQLHNTGADLAYANQRGVIRAGFRYRRSDIVLPELVVRPLLELSAVLVRRDIVDQIGEFDEGLPRGADYDYLIRLAQVTRFQYTPTIGWEVSVHPPPYPRISLSESEDWIEVVQTRHQVDWAAQARRFRVPNLRSWVVPIDDEAEASMTALASATGASATRWEAVIVDSSEGDRVARSLAPRIDADPRITYVRMPVRGTFEHAATLGFARTHGLRVTLLDADGGHRTLEAADVIAAQRVRPEQP